MVNFVNGSPPILRVVKMPAKGGHLDLTDDQIKQIAEEVIEHAVAYKPEKSIHTTTFTKGFLYQTVWPVVSTAIEKASPSIAWPPGKNAPKYLHDLHKKENQIIKDAVHLGVKAIGNELAGFSDKIES